MSKTTKTNNVGCQKIPICGLRCKTPMVTSANYGSYDTKVP